LVDYLTPEARSAMMSRIRGKDTGPELTVRRIVHALGYRYRLHCRDLPGTPDLVLRRLRKVIFVHGCFWHRHANCPYAYTPKSRQSFWRRKFRLNKQRDLMQLRKLTQEGWAVLVIWECQLASPTSATRRISTFLARGRSHSKPMHLRRQSGRSLPPS
jgi:DNA mismatch endonuclease (patch repair protein)